MSLADAIAKAMAEELAHLRTGKEELVQAEPIPLDLIMEDKEEHPIARHEANTLTLGQLA